MRLAIVAGDGYVVSVLNQWRQSTVALCAAVTFAAPACAKTIDIDITETVPVSESEVPIALLVDISSGQVLFERNADRRFVPASITKAMTTFVAFELMQEGTIVPDQMMTVSPETWKEWNGQGSTMWLNAGSQVRVGDLLTGIATVSANDASVVFAKGAAGSVEGWTGLMNAKAEELGMVSSQFHTPNGWPDEGRTFTTARDLVKLAEAMVRRHPKKFANYVGRPEFFWNGISQPNHDPIIGRVKGADGIKTGFTNEAGHGFLGTAQRGSQRLVMVIGAATSYGARTRNSRSLMEWGFSAFDSEDVFSKGESVGEVRVQGGSSRSVALITDRNVRVNVPKEHAGEMKVAIRYDGPVRAP
ncbi:MAG: D-alanyl-D-alanine carboxypeptidase family protein, partial [Pseudomonadota bacterium]